MSKNRVRPVPVSCQSCRAKKLKCSRIQPCSNCSARGLTCKFLIPPKSTSGATSDQPLLPRLERLEILVASLQQELRAANASTDALLATTQSRYLDNPVGEVSSPMREVVASLENIGTRDDGLLCEMSDSLAYEIRSIEEILEVPGKPHSDYTTRSKIILPPFDIADSLLRTYETKLVCLCPIVHIPTVRSVLRATYLRLADATSILPSSVALLLSLFSLGAFFSEPSPTSDIATTEASSIVLSKALSKSALDVLDHSRRTSSGTLEDVQAYILMSLALSHIDGFSTRSRMLFSSALTLARDLRLHRLDECDDATGHPTDGHLAVEKEIKRRVFWYIASEDWLQSTISGPQEGTYWIQNNYIKVHLPRDCTDDELLLGNLDGRTTGDATTHMMIFLERIRLAHICREITDTLPLGADALLQMPYDRIVALDKKLEHFLETMPPLLRHDCPSNEILESIYPQLPSWRYCIAKAALSRRWKLNQTFLLRQNLDPRYTYSRRACVESAQAVIRGYANLKRHNATSALLTRMGIAVHFTHLALSILVMDLCLNRPEADVAQIKDDIKTAFEIFASAPTVSPLLEKSLRSLTAVLQRNHIDLTDISPYNTGHVASNDDGAARSGSEGTEQEPSSYYEVAATDTTFDTFWNIALQDSGDIDLSGWDDLFATLDNRPI